MTSQQKFYSFIYFMPLLLLWWSFFKPLQAPQMTEVEQSNTEQPPAVEVAVLPLEMPTLDIRTGKHETTDDERTIIRAKVIERWDESQWPAFDELVGGESGWIAGRVNTGSGACGLGQSLPCSKYDGELGDALHEADWMIDYIENRYGTPQQALSFWNSKHPHWY